MKKVMKFPDIIEKEPLKTLQESIRKKEEN